MPESQKNQTNQSSGRGGRRLGAGRKRGRPDRATAEEKAGLEERARKYVDTAVSALVEVAQNGESESARVTAASALLDRGYGKPRQAIEYTGEGGGPIQVWHFGSKAVAF